MFGLPKQIWCCIMAGKKPFPLCEKFPHFLGFSTGWIAFLKGSLLTKKYTAMSYLWAASGNALPTRQKHFANKKSRGRWMPERHLWINTLPRDCLMIG